MFAAVGFRAGQMAAAPAPQAPPQPGGLHPVVVNQPGGGPGVDTGMIDGSGNPVLANCTTCHATRQPNRQTNAGNQLEDFHTGLHTNHGGLACVACHNTDNYGTLKLADGQELSFTHQIRLCAQCHGPQHRDYVNGSHGGMNGYWDLARGGRSRNTCTDCHDAHAPQFPTVAPVFKPRDRFLGPPVPHQTPAAGLTGEAPHADGSEPTHE